MDSKGTLQSQLVRTIISVWLVAIVLITAVLALSFYIRDRKLIISETKEKAMLVRVGLLSAMVNTADLDGARGAINQFKKQSHFGFRMVESRYVLRQFGTHDGEFPRDSIEEDVLEGRLEEYSNLSGTTFRLVTPFITDERCGRCHQDMDSKPLGAGKIIGLAELLYDVSAYRNSSLRLLAEIELIIILILTATSYFVYMFLNRSILRPLGEITSAIVVLRTGGITDKELKANSHEMSVLVDEVKKMAASMEEKRQAYEAELEEERKKTDQITNFVFKKTDNLGITNPNDISVIINRLSKSVGEVEKSAMIEVISEYVTLEKKELIIENNIELIRPISLYLTDLIAGKKGNIKKGSIELVLEEAITNAIAHGNLELDSKLKDEDFSEFERLLLERSKLDPYNTRKVRISYDFNGTRAVFKIYDEGGGFDWGTFMKKEAAPDLLAHGRGLIIIRAFSSSVSFNEKGNELIVTFDI